MKHHKLHKNGGKIKRNRQEILCGKHDSPPKCTTLELIPFFLPIRGNYH